MKGPTFCPTTCHNFCCNIVSKFLTDNFSLSPLALVGITKIKREREREIVRKIEREKERERERGILREKIH